MSYSSPSCPAPLLRQQMVSPTPSASIRRPLRSSPLAGPSLQLTTDGRVSELALASYDISSPKPSRISSMPELPSEALSLTPVKLPKRITTTNAPIPLQSSLPSPPPSPSRRLKSRDNHMSIPLPEHHYGPQFPRAYNGGRSLPTSPNASRDSLLDDSWLTTSPYGSTPKFSRLSLNSKHVIMPVSAKDRRTSTVPALPTDAPHAAASGQSLNLEKRVSLSSLFPTASTSSLPPLPPSNPPSIRSKVSTRSIRSSTSFRSLRSIRSDRSLRYTSTSTSECDVIAEIQDEFGTRTGGGSKESDFVPSPGEHLPTPAPSLKDHGEENNTNVEIMPRSRRPFSLPKISTFLKRSRSPSTGSAKLGLLDTAIAPPNEPVSVLPTGSTPLTPSHSVSESTTPRAESLADTPSHVTPVSAVSETVAHMCVQPPVENAVVLQESRRKTVSSGSADLIPKQHTKGTSFLSFSSSDDQHAEGEDLTVRPSPAPTSALPLEISTPPNPPAPKPVPPTLAVSQLHGSPCTSSSSQSPTPLQNKDCTLMPSSPASSESSAHLLTPTDRNAIAPHNPVHDSNAKAPTLLGVEDDDTMSLLPPLSPLSPQRPITWTSPYASRPDTLLRPSASFTSIPSSVRRATRSPSTHGLRSKAMSLLSSGDLPPSGAHTGSSLASHPLPPIRTKSRSGTDAGSGSVRKFFRALTMRKSAT